MSGIFTYILHKNQPNVGKYAIHGSYGYISYTSSQALDRVDSPKRAGVILEYLEDRPRACK